MNETKARALKVGDQIKNDTTGYVYDVKASQPITGSFMGDHNIVIQNVENKRWFVKFENQLEGFSKVEPFFEKNKTYVWKDSASIGGARYDVVIVEKAPSGKSFAFARVTEGVSTYYTTLTNADFLYMKEKV